MKGDHGLACGISFFLDNGFISQYQKRNVIFYVLYFASKITLLSQAEFFVLPSVLYRNMGLKWLGPHELI
jgi:ABC-type multidrug transport system permease subunit